jgi:hypothetical protein
MVQRIVDNKASLDLNAPMCSDDEEHVSTCSHVATALEGCELLGNRSR